MENTQIVKREEHQSFIERLVEKAGSLEDVKKVGDVIIASGFCPDHFKASKDAVGVIMCIEAGKQLGMSWMQALSDLYPVKGRIGMMGDAAVALIQGSGILEYWKEETTGNYPDPNYTHIVISKRKGFPNENRSEFSMFDANTAGLSGKDIYKKFGKRMLRYRNVGFHARDFYPDIMKGMKTIEELRDYDLTSAEEGKTTVLTADGKELKIQDDKKVKAENISQSAKSKIDQANGPRERPIQVQDADVVTEPVLTEEENKAQSDFHKPYAEDELMSMKNELVTVAKAVIPPAKYALLSSGTYGKKEKRLFIDAIIAQQNGHLDAWMDAKLKERQKEEPKEQTPPVKEKEVNTEGKGVASFESERRQDDGFVIFEPTKVIDKQLQRSFPEVWKLDQYLMSLGITEGKVGMNKQQWDTFLKTASSADVNAMIQKNS